MVKNATKTKDLTTTRHYSLNSKQLHILKLIYKFRFVNSNLLSRYKNLTQRSIKRSLETLFEQEYIGRKFSKEYLLQGKGVTYFLRSKAISILRSEEYSEESLKSRYNDGSLSDNFIDHNLDVFKAYLSLRDSYPGVFNIFTKSELSAYDYFPKDKPDLYLRRLKVAQDKPSDYLLNVFNNTQTYFIKKRVAMYIDHFDEDEWQDVTKEDYPTVLIVCPNQRAEDDLREQVAKILDNMGIDDIWIYTTTIKALLSANSVKAIWCSIYETEKLTSL